MTRRFMLITFILTVLCLSATTLQAQWAEEGIPFSQGTPSVGNQNLIPDGEGGVVFFQYYAGPGLTAARYDRHGREVWSVEVPRYGTIFYAYGTMALPDGQGSFWLVYYGLYNSVQTAVVNRIDMDGGLLLGDGVVVSGATPAMYPQRVLCDDASLCLAWKDNSTSTSDIYAQKVALDGTILWAADGVPVCTATGEQEDHLAVSDGSGGLIVVWTDYRAGNWDIYAQRVNSAGANAWTADGEPVCTDIANQGWLTACSDDAGGMIACWQDYRGAFAIFGQRIDGSGAMLWTTDGTAVAWSTGVTSYTDSASDGAGGIIVAWSGARVGIVGLYAQRVDAAGNPLWLTDGSLISESGGITRDVRIAVDTDATAHYVWEDYRGDDFNIGRQRTSDAGHSELGMYGTVVYDASGDQDNPTLCLDDSGALFVCWEDNRDGFEDTWAQRFEPDDSWGFLGAMLDSAADVPDDQGGFVNLAWYASRLDVFPNNDISNYTLWRSLIGDKADRAATVIHDPSDWSPDLAGPVVLSSGEKGYFWELIDTVTPYGIGGYGRIVATPYDSVSVTSPPIHYMVITHTDLAETFWLSAPLNSLSVDNLAPEAPKGLTGEAIYTPEGLGISWFTNPEDDISHYVLYRGATPNFVPDSGNLVATLDDTLFFDDLWADGDYFRLTAVDVHGNEGPSTLLSPDSLTDIGVAPRALHMAQNAPNPFNPSTKIVFALSRSERVELTVYDVSGRLVRTLIDGALPAGEHASTWDGRNASGRPSASGAYFAVLRAGGDSRTRKMTLVK